MRAHFIALYILRTSKCETFRNPNDAKENSPNMWNKMKEKSAATGNVCCKIYFIVYWFAIEFKYSNKRAAKYNA